MKKHLFLLVAACLVFASCGTSKFFAQQAPEIRSIALVQPYSFVTDAVGDLATNYLEDASNYNQQIVTELAATIMPVDTVINLDYGEEGPDSNLAYWMHHLRGLKAKDAQDIIIPAALRNLVKESGYRYGMVLTDIGYAKNPKQYMVEKVVETGIALIGLLADRSVYVGATSDPYENGLYSLIFDSQTGKVVWFGNRLQNKSYNPLDPSKVGKQLKKLYKDFL